MAQELSLAELGPAVFVLLTLLLLGLVALRPRLVEGRGGPLLLSVVFLGMPVLALAGGTSAHMEKSKSTRFCLSCHVMDDYGKTLWLDDTDYLAAAHFQNNLIDRDHACYTCHTNYTMFGDVQAKLAGFKHLVVNYLGTVPEQIELYRPYENRECLHCHEGGRDYLEMHGDFEEELLSGETSCLECHDLVHPVDELDTLELWEPST